jgi:hypothetical protein
VRKERKKGEDKFHERTFKDDNSRTKIKDVNEERKFTIKRKGRTKIKGRKQRM